jgi:hypothetical protein
MRLKNQNSGLKTFSAIIILILIFDLVGCEAFVKKFTRKKKTEEKEEELVLAPEEYKDTMTKEERYRQHFEFWKSWQTELYESLLQKKSNKKQVDCANEAIKNLFSMRQMLNLEKQKKLDIYINQMKNLKDSIESDTYGYNTSTYMQKADSIRMNILRDFSYKKIESSLL